MKFIEKQLIDKVKNISGNLLVIGVESDKVIEEIHNNKNIIISNSLDDDTKNKNKGKEIKRKVVSIRKIRRLFKKKKIDYLICNIEKLNRFMRNFIKDSIYICKKEVIFYGNINDYDINKLIKRYKRYNVVIDIKEKDKEFYLIINAEKAKNNKFKDLLYYIKDSFSDAGDFISEILVN